MTTAIKTKEQQAAELLETMHTLLADEGFKTIGSRVKVLEGALEQFKGIDLKKTIEEVDRIKARTETMQNAIRTSKRGLYVSGLEDAGKNFSLMRAINAIKTNNFANAGYEKEIMDSIRAKASQQVGQDTLGGYFVPDQVIPDVIEAIYTRSAFIQLVGEEGETSVSVYDGLAGAAVKIPKFEGGMIAYWIGEEDEYTESQATVGDITMNPKKLGLLMRMTDAMKRFQGYGFEQRVRKDAARALAKKLDWTMLFGTGTQDMPRGILSHDGIKIYRAENGNTYTPAAAAALTDWAGGDLNFDALMNMALSLEEDDIMLDESAKIVSCPRYFNKLKQAKILNFTSQTTGQPYLLGTPMLSDAKLKDYIGPYAKSNQISSISKAGATVGGTSTGAGSNLVHTTVVGGNLNEVVLGRWGAIEIEDDAGKGKGFTSDHTYVKMRMYADIAIRQQRAIIVCPDAQVR